jgi:hypothetical protein
MQQLLADDGAWATTPIGFILKCFLCIPFIIHRILENYIKCFLEGLMNNKLNQLHICTQ